VYLRRVLEIADAIAALDVMLEASKRVPGARDRFITEVMAITARGTSNEPQSARCVAAFEHFRSASPAPGRSCNHPFRSSLDGPGPETNLARHIQEQVLK
jgi:hypothetical protein